MKSCCVLRILSLLLVFFAVRGYASKFSPNVDSVLTVLDSRLEAAPSIIASRQDSLLHLHASLSRVRSDAQRYALAFESYRGYSYFDNDSALHYLYICKEIADRIGDGEKMQLTLLRIGHQHVMAGYFVEAEAYFKQVSPMLLQNDNLPLYYHYWSHFYRELEQYTTDSDLRRSYHHLAKTYHDSVEQVSVVHNAVYWQRRCLALCAEGNFDEADQVVGRWTPLVSRGTPGYSYLASCRSDICGSRGHIDVQKYWLAVSAINDVDNCNMNLSSLWKLAEIIYGEGDTQRAMRYIDYAWTSISRFSIHKRAWVMAPVMNDIHNGYQAEITHANSLFRILIFAVGLLAAFLLVALFYAWRERRSALHAQRELLGANARLATANHELFDSNRVKDEYISEFLQLCSEYIEKMDAYRVRINRKLKANQTKDLLKITGSEQLKKDERAELMSHFDSVFLGLFPSFVADFNDLLRPDARITLESPTSLNTVLRIFALVRLGIQESSKIAVFLDYSANSIYNYRSRIKNMALVPRSDFEQCVRRIGM